MSSMGSSFSAGRVAVIGLGLIGGSLVRALRRAAAAEHIAGCVRTDADVALARELNLADSVTTSVADAVAGADIVVVAVGVNAMEAVFDDLRDAVGASTVITDVGSTKCSVIAAARATLGAELLPRFVPGHPISGTENSGLRAGIDGLFAGRRTILTPVPETDTDACERVRQLWEATGATVTTMASTHHDEVLAATSHLPHVVAFALVDTLADMSERSEIFDYAAGGFADFTRIASSDPELWCDIMFANREAVLPALAQYIDKLESMRSALQNSEKDTISDCFSRSKKARDQFTGGAR